MAGEEKKAIGAFEVVYIVMLGALLVLAVFFMGKPRIGIIDLGRVAEEVGVEERIIDDAQQWRDTAGADLKKLKDQYKTLGQDIRAKADEAETDEEKAALKKDLTETVREYYSHSGRVRTRVRRHQQAVLKTFRKRVDPFVTEVARKRRLWLVLDRSARLVYATAKVDITDDVIEKAEPFFAKEMDLIDVELTEDDLVENVSDIEDEDELVEPAAEEMP